MITISICLFSSWQKLDTQVIGGKSFSLTKSIIFHGHFHAVCERFERVEQKKIAIIIEYESEEKKNVGKSKEFVIFPAA